MQKGTNLESHLSIGFYAQESGRSVMLAVAVLVQDALSSTSRDDANP